MEFKPIPDDEENLLTDCYQLNNIISGKYRVMFGYRLRVGYEGTGYCNLDLCCGMSEKHYKELRDKIFQLIIYNVEHNLDPFENIPTYSEIKPYYHDDNFLEYIDQLCEDYEITPTPSR